MALLQSTFNSQHTKTLQIEGVKNPNNILLRQ